MSQKKLVICSKWPEKTLQENRMTKSLCIRISTVFALLLAVLGSAVVPAAAQDTPITVWIDTPRQPAMDAYKKAFPEKAKLIKSEIVDREQFPAKVLLFNNVGSGWPDVVFAEPNLIAQVADASRDFPLDLKPFVSKTILDGFAVGANADCILPDGKIICLRNDLAQNVLYYNKPLMEKFGYAIPKTWEEYQAIGEKVAKDHPGYVIGAFGDSQALNAYFFPGRCPTGQLQSPTKVYINMKDPKCTRVAALVDTLLANKSLSSYAPFSKEFADIAKQDKLLLMVGASWYGEYIFGGKADSVYYTEAKGQLGVAMPLKWAAEEKAWTGAQGGAAWTVSRHTTNPQLAADLAIFMTTSVEVQGTAPTFPAYLPAAAVWAKTVAGNKLYANDPFPVFKDASELIDPLWSNVRFDRADAFLNTVLAAVNDGKTVTSSLEAYDKLLQQLASAQGYEVVTSK